MTLSRNDLAALTTDLTSAVTIKFHRDSAQGQEDRSATNPAASIITAPVAGREQV